MRINLVRIQCHGKPRYNEHERKIFRSKTR